MDKLPPEEVSRLRDRPSLTSRQAEILAAIVTLRSSEGFPPTVREIGRAVGLSSSATVHKHLVELAELGVITMGGGARRIRIHVPSLVEQTTGGERS